MAKDDIAVGDIVRFRDSARGWVARHAREHAWIAHAFEHKTEHPVLALMECYHDTVMVRVRYAMICISAPIPAHVFEKTCVS